MVETDSPYLAPEPNRGKRNDSRNVKYIAQKLAEVKPLNIAQASRISGVNPADISILLVFLEQGKIQRVNN